MAFNSWDKLAKAQRDYPNPKYAWAVADKALKKQPSNPYLITWQVDLFLQQNVEVSKVLMESMVRAHQLSIVDTQLLAYMYQTFIEVLRRDEKRPTVNTIGIAALGTWQSAAKSMQRKLDRIALWDLLFYTAMRADCWEDVRFAILNYNKEGSSDKKQSHYSLIIATQLAAEQRALWKGPEDPMAKLQPSIVLQLMKQAYAAPAHDPLAIKTITDLRFIAKIFARQHRSHVLRDLWNEPSDNVKVVLDRHRQDVQSMMIQHFWEQKNWPLLEEHCVGVIEEIVSDVHLVGGSKSRFWELCAWRWDLWSGLLAAVNAQYPEQKRQMIISSHIQQCFGNGLEAKDRPLQLTYIKLRDQLGISMLSDCKDYFQHHSHLNSCFNDLKPIVCRLPVKEFKSFMSFILDWTSKLLGESENLGNWRQNLVNMLKFHYMLAQSLKSPMAGMPGILRAAVRISQLFPEDTDVGCLVIYILLSVHFGFTCHNEPIEPLERRANIRILLQAAMFARHLVENDKEKQNRTFALLATRLHLSLGLGTIAFRLYRHVKCKEMLVDTLSPYLLSCISQTHPFEVKGYGGFSADEELANVIGTIERMEKKTDSYLFKDIPSFVWDQATDTLAVKRKLGSSLTKHLCVVERRRIARLKGQSVNDLPILNSKGKLCTRLLLDTVLMESAYNEISDNIDHKVFPDFAHEIHNRPLDPFLCGFLPGKNWLYDMQERVELPSRGLYGEASPRVTDLSNTNDRVCYEAEELVGHTRAEMLTREFWDCITAIMHTFGLNAPAKVDCELLLVQLKNTRKGFEKLRMPGNTTLKPEDDPAMFHESMLMHCYGFLEVCRGVHRLGDWLFDTVLKAKNHPKKAKLSEKFLKDLQEEAKVLFQAVRDVAQSYIDLILKRGVRSIKAQVRWGATGEELKVFLSDDDVEYYAKEYVESALEAWKGVLKVKLK